MQSGACRPSRSSCTSQKLPIARRTATRRPIRRLVRRMAAWEPVPTALGLRLLRLPSLPLRRRHVRRSRRTLFRRFQTRRSTLRPRSAPDRSDLGLRRRRRRLHHRHAGPRRDVGRTRNARQGCSAPRTLAWLRESAPALLPSAPDSCLDAIPTHVHDTHVGWRRRRRRETRRGRRTNTWRASWKHACCGCDPVDPQACHVLCPTTCEATTS
mmetsp:Transcript_8508/g.53161  ORF Transcript_8508/g.53161 Transcript_8508/m.53161 type:complete len:212 (+) Transcript_8508:2805-3440(+)